jgi:8-oxo-dGDP phosphatase
VTDEPDVRTLATGVVYEDSWMRLRRDEIQRRDGSRGTYAFVEKTDFALVIPAEADGFHLVEEYRYPIGRRTWSFPQGGFPPGTSGSPDDLARLELSQETGLRASTLTKLGFLHCAHGITSQGGHFYLATGLEPGQPEREIEEQDMQQQWVPRTRFEEMVGDGVITDDSTLAGYALLLMKERRQLSSGRKIQHVLAGRSKLRGAYKASRDLLASTRHGYSVSLLTWATSIPDKTSATSASPFRLPTVCAGPEAGWVGPKPGWVGPKPGGCGGANLACATWGTEGVRGGGGGRTGRPWL